MATFGQILYDLVISAGKSIRRNAGDTDFEEYEPQDKLVSATNIKTINGSSILGSGDLVVSSSTSWGGITGTLSSQTDLQSALDGKQPIDSQLTDLAALSYSSNALKVVRVNAGATAFELATISSGSLTITQVQQDLGSTPTWRGKFIVTDAAINTSSKIQVWQAFASLTGKGTRADENEMDLLDCQAEAGTGQFTVYWQTKPMIAISRNVRSGDSRVSALTPYQDGFSYTALRMGRVKGNFKFNYIYA